MMSNRRTLHALNDNTNMFIIKRQKISTIRQQKQMALSWYPKNTIFCLLIIISSIILSFHHVVNAFTIVTQQQQQHRAIRQQHYLPEINSIHTIALSSFQPTITKKASSEMTSSSSSTILLMSSTDRSTSRTTKKSVQTIDKVETKVEEKKNKEEMWRVVLHNDEVHTFNYVVRSLTKVIGILDRKAAFEICVQTHGIGKATITKTWKKQAEQFCLGLQRQGLTVSISPDEDFDGGHSGGGL